MSNQVCASQYSRYLSSFGINMWRLADDQLIVPSQTQTIIYTTQLHLADTENFLYNNVTGNIEFLKSGIYHISSSVFARDNSNPSTVDPDYEHYLYYENLAGDIIVLAPVLLRTPARGGTTGSEGIITTSSITIFCGEGTIVCAKVANAAGTNLKVVADPTTQLLIQRVN